MLVKNTYEKADVSSKKIMKKQLGLMLLTFIVTAVMVLIGSVTGVIIKNIKTQSVFLSVSYKTQSTVKAYAKENGISLHEYPVEILEMLENNAETEVFVLN